VRFTSWGVVSGYDQTYLRSPREGILIGALAGYNDTHGRFSGTGGTDASDIPARSQDIEGAMLGLYGSYFHREFAIDVLAKTDLFDFDQRIRSDCQTALDAAGSTNLINFLVASNIYYRRDMGHFWLEPTAGLRYIHSYFGDGASALGVGDGDALRLQAGVRVGTDWMDVDRRLWTVSFLAGIYSEVMVNGFSTAGDTVVLQTDEGKVRALGQIRTTVTTAYGFSYYGQAEVRGGEDYFGVAGKVGLRYGW
jgi:outer membrane autotransporter protein